MFAFFLYLFYNNFMFIIEVLMGIGGIEAIAIVCAMVVALLFAITFHEFAHAVVAYWCGDITAKTLGRLTLNPFKHLDWIGALMLLLFGFGYAKPVPVNTNNFKHPKRDMAFVSLAGVVCNIILAIISSLLFVVCNKYLTNINFFAIFLKYSFYLFTVYNISLAIFNILPIYPLDGFNFMMTFVKDKGRFLQFSIRYGAIILVAVIIAFSWLLSDLNLIIFNGLYSMWSLLF